MLVKNAENYINRLKKIIIARFGNIETAITHDDDCDMHAVQISFLLNGKYSWVCAYDDDDVITYYVSGKGHTKEMSIETTQLASMYKVLDKVEDLAYSVAEETETSEAEETEEVAESEEPEEPEETEETVKDVMEVKQALNRRFGKEQPNKTIIAKIEDINYCPNQNTCCVVSPFVHCDYNYKSDACIKAHKKFIHYCEQVHKQIKATEK